MFRDRDGWRVAWRKPERGSRWFPDKRSAEKFEAERMLGIVAPDDVSPTFAEWAAEWHRIYCRVEKAESQWRKDARAIRLHLEPQLGAVRLRALRASHLVAVRDHLRAKTAHGKRHALSPKTINIVLALAKKIMASAVERELVPANPFHGVKLVRLGPQRFRYWTAAEREKFLEHADRVDPDFSRLVRAACHTGLRLGELGALTHGDIDLVRRKVRVTKTWDVGLAKVLHMTKGRHDDDVPLNDEAVRALAGGPFERSLFWNARKRLGRLARAAGVPDIRFHDLRHGYASGLAMAGMDLMLIQRLMRHKSYAMTLRYAHLHPDHLAGATDVLCDSQVTRIGPRAAKSGGSTRT